MEQQRMAPLLFRSITHKFFTGIIRQNCQGIENVRSLIYFFPIAINILIGGMFFISAYRFKLAEAPGWIIGATMAAWALVYSIFSLLLSRRLTRKNAPVILNTGCFILTASSAGFLFFDGLYTQFVWILTSGLANACYCAPFQLLMKSVEPDQASAGSARAAGMYTFAWSTGVATGPLLFGWLAPATVFKINVLLSILLWAGAFLLICRIRRKEKNASSRSRTDETVMENTAFSEPSLARLGWIAGGVGIFTACIIRLIWPCRGVELELSQVHIGSSLALVSYIQAVMGLILAHSRNWMRKALPQLIYGILGVAGLCLFAFAPGEAWYFYLAALLYGLYSSNFYFLLVYFSIEDTAHAAENVGVNEFIVGITSIIAPMIGGVLAVPGHSARAFYPGIVSVALVTVFMVISLARISGTAGKQ